MPSLFQYHFNQALTNAISTLKEECRKNEAGGSQQTDFNVNIQIAKMQACLEAITTIKVDSETPDWSQLLETIQQTFVKAGQEIDHEIEQRQAKDGGNLSKALFQQAHQKAINMFREMLSDAQQEPFAAYMNQDQNLFTSVDSSQSPFLNQLVNIALEYRFNKTQEKFCQSQLRYSSKHQKKWTELKETIESWADIEQKDVKNSKRIIRGLITDLQQAEQNIQCEKGESLTGQVRGMFGWAVSLVTVTEEDLGPKLTALKDRFVQNQETSARPSQIAF